MILALNAYLNAIAARIYWENHGRWGDGQLERAKRVEGQARRALLAIMRGRDALHV